MSKRIIRLTESDLRRIVKKSAKRIIKEAFEYRQAKESAMSVANAILGFGTDSDSLRGFGEDIAQYILNNGNDETTKERVLKPFIEGLVAWYKNPGDPNIVYRENGID